MSYAQGYPVRPVGGRLVLDFLNTADWSQDDGIVVDHLVTLKDASTWLAAVGADDLHFQLSVNQLQQFRGRLRRALLSGGSDGTATLRNLTEELMSEPNSELCLENCLAFSALCIMIDRRELDRLKRCPGTNCGALFIDESKNRRRKWCSMEVCGNRAKAHRFQERAKLASSRECGLGGK